MVGMVTSRTGTGAYRAWRSRVLSLARAEGLVLCPDCGRELEWGTSLRPRSPEPDHVVPAALGGRNTLDNARVVCRECNQRRGSRAIPASAPTAPHTVGVLW